MKYTFFSVLLFMILETVSGATWYVDESATLPSDGTSWKTAFKTIQQGVDAASDRDTVIVDEGTYIENIHFKGKNIILRSTEPLNNKVVQNTIINGKGAGSVVTFLGTEKTSCVLSGFTIQNGVAQFGGGILGQGALATIRNNTISGNSAEWYGGGLAHCHGTIQNNIISGNSMGSHGGGLAYCDGLIQDNTISGNGMGTNGGGLAVCQGTIQNNVITGNSSNGAGGGLWDCDGAIRNNVITGNLAGGNGGGLFWCSGTVENNVVVSNSAEGGGGGLAFCSGTIRNNTISINRAEDSGGGLNNCSGTIETNLISSNSAGGRGGGLYGCNAMIRNDTISGNTGGLYGGALAECHGTIQNCIIWGNTAPTGPGLSISSSPTYSCIQSWTGGGEGNTTGDPHFTDPDGPDNDPETYEDNDYRLSPGSPCIDAGSNQSWMGQAADLDGNPRVFHGGSSLTVDMGAYEYGFFAFRVTELSKDPTGKTRVTWNSRPGETYIVWWRYKLLTDVWAQGPTINSGGDTTTWTDFDTISPDKFYRIELE